MANKILETQKNIFRKIYSCQEYNLEIWREYLIQAILRLLRMEKGDVYLDIGCGSGYNIIEAAKKDIFSVGIDLSGEGIKKAKEFSRRVIDRNVYYIISNAECLPFKSQTFSKISNVQVLEHIENDTQAMGEMIRISKHKCRIFLSTINSIKNTLLPLKPLFYIHEKKAGHVRGYMHEDIIKYFREKNFRFVDLLYYTHAIKLIQDVLCSFFPSLKRQKSKLWRKITALDYGFKNLRTGWTVAVVVEKN